MPPKVAAFKKLFFDRAAVTDAVDKASVSVLSKFGAFVRRAARSSIKKARQMPLSELSDEQRAAYKRRLAIATKQGKPRPKRPLAASKPGQPPRSRLGFLRDFIFFGYDADAHSVVIGPARLNGRAGPQALEALEEGGASTTPQGKRVQIEARPFMGPALAKEEPKLPAMWANSVKG